MTESELSHSSLSVSIIHFEIDQEPGGSLVSLLVLVQVEYQLALDGEGESLVSRISHGLFQEYHAAR